MEVLLTYQWSSISFIKENGTGVEFYKGANIGQVKKMAEIEQHWGGLGE
jgi:hypothetical protein